jgi:hypothetical protein
VCRIDTSAAASAITRSIGLYAAGISSMNASVTRNSMPTIASRSCSCVKARRAEEAVSAQE